MIDPIEAAIKIAGSGLETQSARLRIVAENLANAQSTGLAPGADPYARKTVTFESELDQATGANLVRIKRVGVDRTPFRIEHDPGSPAADSNGFVKLPNVELLVEMADLREANRSYEANLQVIKQTNSLIFHDNRPFEEFFMIPALSLASSLFGTSAVSQALPAAQQAAAAGSEFGQVFAQVGEAINTLKTGERAAISGLQGQTSVQHVVEVGYERRALAANRDRHPR